MFQMSLMHGGRRHSRGVGETSDGDGRGGGDVQAIQEMPSLWTIFLGLSE